MEAYYLVRMGLVSALSEFPHLQFVGESQHAQDALSQLEEIEVDVIILDVSLPDMNGIELAQTVRERWPNIKIIVLTSHNQPEAVIAALGVGAQAYVLKDIKPHRLAQVIETVQEGAAWLDPNIASVVASLASSYDLGGRLPALFAHLSGEPVSPQRPVVELTDREREVLHRIVEGKNNQEISNELHISIHTTKAHVGSILTKLRVNDRVQAAIKAIRENIV